MSSPIFSGENKKIWGPGHWYIIHTLARDAVTDDKKEYFCKMMDHISKNLPCKECQGHCQNYMKANPFEPYWKILDDGKDIGLFQWTWTFHNAVNKRLGKPYLDWNTAKQMYFTDDGICTSSCDESIDKQPPKPSQTNVTMIKAKINSDKASSSSRREQPSSSEKLLPTQRYIYKFN